MSVSDLLEPRRWTITVSICSLHDAPLFQPHHGCDCDPEETMMARRVEVVESRPGRESSEERWLRQTKVGGGDAPPEERGDCVPACIASILGLPLSAIYNAHGDGWWEELQQSVGQHGYAVAGLDISFDPPDDIYWIASVPSLNLTDPEPSGKLPLHCIVVRGRTFVHDTALGQKYDQARWVDAWNNDKVAEGWVLVELDPAVDAVSGKEGKDG